MLMDLKYRFVRTPLEMPLMWLRRVLGYRHRRRHPELREVFLEDLRIPAIMKRFIDARSNCIDVGCHYGSILSSFCRLAPGGRHLAFEAIPSKVQFLKRKFPDVDVRELALSDHAGVVVFFVNRRASGYSGLAPMGEGTFERIQVASARLDDVLPTDRRFDFVKIDVEGAELLVLRGALGYLERDRPVVLFECGPAGPKEFGHTPKDVYDLLTTQCRYDIFFLRDALDGSRPVTLGAFESALVYPFKAFNWVALPREMGDGHPREGTVA